MTPGPLPDGAPGRRPCRRRRRLHTRVRACVRAFFSFRRLKKETIEDHTGRETGGGGGREGACGGSACRRRNRRRAPRCRLKGMMAWRARPAPPSRPAAAVQRGVPAAARRWWGDRGRARRRRVCRPSDGGTTRVVLHPRFAPREGAAPHPPTSRPLRAPPLPPPRPPPPAASFLSPISVGRSAQASLPHRPPPPPPLPLPLPPPLPLRAASWKGGMGGRPARTRRQSPPQPGRQAGGGQADRRSGRAAPLLRLHRWHLHWVCARGGGEVGGESARRVWWQTRSAAMGGGGGGVREGGRWGGGVARKEDGRC